MMQERTIFSGCVTVRAIACYIHVVEFEDMPCEHRKENKSEYLNIAVHRMYHFIWTFQS